MIRYKELLLLFFIPSLLYGQSVKWNSYEMDSAIQVANSARNWNKVIAYSKTGIKADIDYYKLRLSMANAYYYKGNYSAALYQANKAMPFNRGDSCLYQLMYAACYYLNESATQDHLNNITKVYTNKNPITGNYLYMELGKNTGSISAIYKELYYSQLFYQGKVARNNWIACAYTVLNNQREGNEIFQSQYYLKWTKQQSVMLQYNVGLHVANANVYASDKSTLASVTDIMLGLSVKKQMGKLAFEPNINIDYINKNYRQQFGLVAYLDLKGNKNWVVKQHTSLIRNQDGNSSFLFNQHLIKRVLKNNKLWFNLNYLWANSAYFSLNNAFNVYNNPDIVIDKWSFVAEYIPVHGFSIVCALLNERRKLLPNEKEYSVTGVSLGLKLVM